MATIKAIEARSVHQIQSGQVIVDLCSVVKELVENSLDANATSVEVRFKNHGLDAIEVQDNGDGISRANYESVALKHHTSKLSTYEDLSSLKTFGFRGEALSSLCALSTFSITTARADEAPKGRRLDFESSGKLKCTTVIASQKGTTAYVEGLFEQLPVRRKELAKNIKREYGKVLGLLHAYACICVGVKFSVKTSMPKGRNATVFATNGNPTTKENIANIYGAKTLSALVPLELELEFQSSSIQTVQSDERLNKIFVHGHISRPVYGEGRQTPDRQMFFVNSRPCGLPQVARVFNEIYKSFNMSQSPFIFADFHMDTDAYDVNVSPDKRTILLHDSATLLDRLKGSLNELFERQEQTMPQSQLQTPRLHAFKPLSVHREVSRDSLESSRSDKTSESSGRRPSLDAIADAGDEEGARESPNGLLQDFFRNQTSTRAEPEEPKISTLSKSKQKLGLIPAKHAKDARRTDEYDDVRESNEPEDMSQEKQSNVSETIHVQHVKDFNDRMAEQHQKIVTERVTGHTGTEDLTSEQIPISEPVMENKPNVIQNAFDRMRPNRNSAEIATITIGDKTVTTLIGSRVAEVDRNHRGGPSKRDTQQEKKSGLLSGTHDFSQALRGFVAPGTQKIEDKPTRQNYTDESAPDVSSDGESDLAPDNNSSASEQDSDDISQASEQDPDDISQASEHDTDDVSQASEHDPDDASAADQGVHEPQRLHSDMQDPDEPTLDDIRKAEEEAKVEALIRAAEERATRPIADSKKRASGAFRRTARQDTTIGLSTRIDGSLQEIEAQVNAWLETVTNTDIAKIGSSKGRAILAETDEDRLSLTVSKSQFADMHVIGQFNLGFILAVRPSSISTTTDPKINDLDELFIIDQHASDEKFNFERLQTETIVGNQRLVRPLTLDLTAVEEEILMDNPIALEKNGFIVETDTTGEQPIGQRCRLISLPLSKEVVFNTRDLEELIHLLAESPVVSEHSVVPRPAKVRKMFAMRACRSSIMIGKTLSQKQMIGVVRHMGEIDKPWNCPHGRPTMRHLMSLDDIDIWQEGVLPEQCPSSGTIEAEIWSQYGR